jgi:hypothetical protein
MADRRRRGEGGTVPALAVVINAIVDALSEFGVRHIEMPTTPENAWRAAPVTRRTAPVQPAAAARRRATLKKIAAKSVSVPMTV